MGQLYRLAHDIDLNDIVCGNIDRLSHKKHLIFVILYVNDTHETCNFIYFFMLSIIWKRKHACERASNFVTLNRVILVITTAC